MGFQTTINVQPGLAKPGDFASSNPRSVVLADAGGFIAGTGGVTVGRFAWTDRTNNSKVVNAGTGLPRGFVANELQALITTYLAESSSVVPAGQPVTLYDQGDFWVVSSTQALLGQKVYANYATGAIRTAVTASPLTGGSVTASVAAGAGSVTASIAPTYSPSGVVDKTIMTVTAVGSGSLQVGATISGSGVTTGTTITEQLSGTANGVGTYAVSIPQTAASTTVTAAHGLMTVTAVGSGALAVGNILSGTGVDAGTVITALGTGTGGTGTYIVSSATVVSSTTVTATGDIETKWYVASVGAANELIKITSWGQ
ncbi:MAG: structural cement protein Gp24 [Candidatus Binatia bacterium]